MSFKGKKHSEETKKKMSLSALGKPKSEETKRKLRELNKGENNPNFGMKHSKERKQKAKERFEGDKNPSWKGGLSKLKIPLYDTYAPILKELDPGQETRRDPNDNRILQVKCTYCGKWITVKLSKIGNRLMALKGQNKGESRFYCVDSDCRNQCDIYHRRKYPKSYEYGTSREVQPELRKLVFERDNYTCQREGCPKTCKTLHCHHIDPVSNNPIESADINNCITYCKDCHKEAHKQPGCSLGELKC